MRDWGRLLRLSLLPSAVADIAAGVALGAGSWPSGAGPFLLIAASLAVYHGALALNDWADREWDRETRAARPIPSGRIAPRAALALAAGLLVLAVPLAFASVAGLTPGPAAVGCPGALLAAALLAVAYDLGPRGPRLGPTLLACCRGLNLASGILFGAAASAGSAGTGDAEPALGAIVVAAYASYVFLVSRLGRLEDGEDDAEPGQAARLLRRLGGLLLLVGALAALRTVLFSGSLPAPRELAPLVVGGAGAFGLLRLARRTDWTRALVVQSMGAALRRLLVFTATAALLVPTTTGLVVAGGVLAGYPVSFALRRAFPPS